MLEALGEPLQGVVVGKGMRYGVPVYEIGVTHQGKSYDIVVAEDGTLVEKLLVIEDRAFALEKCPAEVQATLKAHAGGGTIVAVVRSLGIAQPIFEAEVMIRGKNYLIEVDEAGHLLAKSLESGPE